ncbi:MAG: peptidase MA family metallohydrolase [Anaerolineales bacterium]|nr:peptidase MA family metallohydrolase [Anaerolineales bacterium]
MKRPILLLLLLLVIVTAPSAAGASPALQASQNQAILNFPNSVTFRAQLTAETTIQSVVLEYGDTQLTCGEVVAKAFPPFKPGKTVNVQWTWDMRQSGSIPPGATLWWRWRVTDSNGKETVTDTKTITWLDSTHRWQTLTDRNLRIHWYKGNEAFAREILAAARDGLALNRQSAGLEPNGVIEIYIYGDYEALRSAVLYTPSWTGGMAFPEFNIVIIGIAPNNLEWGKDATVHELTHVLVGNLTFSCLGDVPTWLNEGLAVYSEGGLDAVSQQQLERAIREDTLLTVRSISGAFSEVADKANLSYSQSYSIVKFLVETYGQPKMNQLLLALRDGTPIDEALRKVYGFDIEGLEDAWRASIGARPRAAVLNPTATPQPTHVPTIVPVGGAPLAITPTPFVVPTSSTSPENAPPSATPLPAVQASGESEQETNLSLLWAGIGLLCCCIFGLVLVTTGVIFFVRRGQKGQEHA